MKKLLFTKILVLCLVAPVFSQLRPASPIVVEKSYSHTRIHNSLRDLVNQSDKTAYFNESFFNSMLRKVILDAKFTDVEKVSVFYLMLQKIGYGFAGVEYIPPTQNYFQQHTGKVFVLEGCSKSLEGLSLRASRFVKVTAENFDKDPLLAANALLLATLLGRDSVARALEHYSTLGIISKSSQPAIFNHYVCLSISLVQNDTIVAHLRKNLFDFKQETMIEDVICALYSRNNPVAPIQQYVAGENDSKNDLAIQTALNALHTRVPEGTYERGLKALALAAQARWKQELLKDMLAGKFPYGYRLSTAETLVTKPWDGVTLSQYSNGSLISIGELMEFDPN